MGFSRDSSAGFLANHMARLFARGLQGRIAPLGLAPAQFMTLLELWEEDGQTQRSLTDRLDVEQATMANTLARMERDGLIERVAHPQDKRARIIRLTDRARALRDPAIAAAQAQNAQALAGLDAAEQAELLRLMGRVVAQMKGA